MGILTSQSISIAILPELACLALGVIFNQSVILFTIVLVVSNDTIRYINLIGERQLQPMSQPSVVSKKGCTC